MIDEKIYLDALRTLIVMTASGSAVALLLFALKSIIKNRLPKTAGYYLWLVVIAALLVPVSRFVTLPGDSGESVYLPGTGRTIQGAPATIYETVQLYALSTEESIDVLHSDEDFYDRTYDDIPGESLVFPIMDVMSVVYPFGFAAVLLYHMVVYAVFLRKTRRYNVVTDIDCPVPVYRNAKAATPMLIGLFRPVVVLPDRAYTDEHLRAVLLHELTHWRRKDILVKWLSVFACAVHWFNPIVWLTRREIDRACELSCDEAVVRDLDPNGRQHYGETLLYIAAGNPGSPPGLPNGADKTPRAVLSTTMCEDKKGLKERLAAIMKNKKHTRAALAASVAVMVAAVLAACALGAGRESGDADYPIATVSYGGASSVITLGDKDHIPF
ncbi:MAG: M56 family metallopeptidase, partial [Oscillospiraceae bacterium]|nr:M56 family metallopeptidase [Oscillospiraceae bacterium]